MRRDRFQLIIFTACMLGLIFGAPQFVSGQTKKDRAQAKIYVDQADEAFQQKNYRDAADKFGQAVALVSNAPNVHFRKGYAHYFLKEYDQALNEFTLALSQGHKPLEIYRVRYFIFYERKDYDAAISDVQKGLQLAPNDLNLIKALGGIYLERKSYTEALQAFQLAGKIAPTDGNIDYNICLAQLGLGDSKSQGVAAETALKKGTMYMGDAFYLLGDADQKQRNFSGAIDAYQKSLNAKPDKYDTYILLADVMRNENRFTDAIGVLKQGLKVFPNDGGFYTNLSWYYSLAGRPDDAIEAAKAGITLLPNQYTAYTNLCRAYNEVKDYEKAITACNNALRLQPDDGESNYYLGNAYVGQGKSTEATGKYSKAVKGLVDYTAKNSDYSDGWYLLGNALFADKQYDKSIDAYLKCLDLSPKFLRARVNLGISYTRKKNKSAATEQYNLLLPADATLAARLKAEIDKM